MIQRPRRLSPEEMRGPAVLGSQHRRVETLFVMLGEAGVDAATLVRALGTHLMAHMVVEEEILYPMIDRARRDAVLAMLEEHALLAFGLSRLLMADIRHESFTAKVMAVRELYDRHSADEERDLLPSLSSTLGHTESDAFGRKMERRFEELLDQGYDTCRSLRGKDEHLASSALESQGMSARAI